MTSLSARSAILGLIVVAGSASAWPLPAAVQTAAPVQAEVAAKPSQDAAGVHQAQVEARVLFAPRAVTGSDGVQHLGYELRIGSFYDGTDPLKLTGVAIFADNATTPLTTFEGPALQALLAQPAAADAPQEGIPIESGRSKTLFLWLSLPAGAQPASLRHQLTFRADKDAIQRADDIRTPVVQAPPLTIASPLRGGRWLAVEGPGNHQSHHWGGVVAIDGKLSIPQRFAIDWFGLDRRNHSVRGKHDSLTSTTDADWVGYGHDVLAVADGVVVDVRDGVPNGKPMTPLETPDDLTARTLYGNFVVLEIAPGVYAHYAHLQTDSVTVAIGQHVHRGTVLGKLGQTGAAGAPHLHFHLSDRPTFEQSEGLPFVIDSFVLLGQGKIEDTFDPGKRVVWPARKPEKRQLQLPLDGSLVEFP